MSWPALEADMTDPVEAYLQDRGYETRREVWIHGRIADLYGWRNDGATVAVELKLHDWKGAVAQAMTYQIGAASAYIAVPLHHANRLLAKRGRLEDRGVGLLAVAPPEARDRVRRLVQASETPRFLPFAADRVRVRAQRASKAGPVWPDRGRR